MYDEKQKQKNIHYNLKVANNYACLLALMFQRLGDRLAMVLLIDVLGISKHELLIQVIVITTQVNARRELILLISSIALLVLFLHIDDIFTFFLT